VKNIDSRHKTTNIDASMIPSMLLTSSGCSTQLIDQTKNIDTQELRKKMLYL